MTAIMTVKERCTLLKESVMGVFQVSEKNREGWLQETKLELRSEGATEVHFFHFIS
jgi:hypothetical protein